MTTDMIKATIASKAICRLALILCVSFTSSVYALENYRVTASVYHLGELIAQPVMDVAEGKTASVTHSKPGEANYTFTVLVRPMAEDQASVSLQFSSGNINIQPNLMVDVGHERSATEDKVLLKLLVEEITQ